MSTARYPEHWPVVWARLQADPVHRATLQTIYEALEADGRDAATSLALCLRRRYLDGPDAIERWLLNIEVALQDGREPRAVVLAAVEYEAKRRAYA